VTSIDLDEAFVLSNERADQMIALDDALERLSGLNDRLSKIVELRFFGGLSIDETAGALGVAPSTVKLDWQKARAWLHRELTDV
jgi:RNA polymerase sigma factor (sigma-70 family)